jgi:hypothetical protein
MAQGGNNPFFCPHCYIPFRYIEELHHHYCPKFILMLQMESVRKKLFEMIQLTYQLPFSTNVEGMVPWPAPPPPYAHPSCQCTFGSQSTTSNVCEGQGPLRPPAPPKSPSEELNLELTLAPPKSSSKKLNLELTL